MSTLYLHIGTPKTGTTAIQYFLEKNADVLKKKGFCFPIFTEGFTDVPPKRNAHFLINSIYQKDANNEEYKNKIQSCYNQLFTALEENENVILTDEAIWHACKKIKDFWQEFLSKIEERGHKLKLIVYLRRQDEFIQSYWKYKVLSSETKDFMSYVNSKKYAFFPLNYYTHLSEISEVVGKENIMVRVYEKEQYQGKYKTIISDFMNTIGLELTDEYEELQIVQNTNVDYICTEVKRRLNTNPEFNNKRGFLREYMTIISEENKQDGVYQFKSLFDPEEQDAFLERYANENSQVAKEYLKREDGRLFYAPVQYDSNSKVLSDKDYVSVCGRIFLKMNEQNLLAKKQKRQAVKELNQYKSRSVFRKAVSAVTPEKLKQTKLWGKFQGHN